MKILESYKKIAKSLLTEHAWDRKFGEPLPTLEDVMREASQDDEDYVHIGYGKYKDKDHVDDPTAPTFKKDDSGSFVPAKGAEKEKPSKEPKGDKEEPKGKALSPDDFERGFDDSDEISTDIADDLADDFQDNYGDMSYDEYMEKGFQDLPNNVMDKLDQLSDDEREEVMDRVRDILDDKFGDGEGDGEGDDGESNYRQDMLKFFQQADEGGQGSGPQPENGSSKDKAKKDTAKSKAKEKDLEDDAMKQAFKDMEDEFDMEEETIVINGKKYREVKEEKKVTEKHILRENYERFGGK